MNSWIKHWETVAADTSGHGKIQGNRLNSSIMLRKKRFLFVEGSGPLKSTLSLSRGLVDFISEHSQMVVKIVVYTLHKQV